METGFLFFTLSNLRGFKAYAWAGKALKERFAIDFTRENRGQPHPMRFGASSLYQAAFEGRCGQPPGL